MVNRIRSERIPRGGSRKEGSLARRTAGPTEVEGNAADRAAGFFQDVAPGPRRARMHSWFSANTACLVVGGQHRAGVRAGSPSDRVFPPRVREKMAARARPRPAAGSRGGIMRPADKHGVLSGPGQDFRCPGFRAGQVVASVTELASRPHPPPQPRTRWACPFPGVPRAAAAAGAQG